MSDDYSFQQLFDEVAPHYEAYIIRAFAPLAINLIEWLAPEGHEWVLDVGTGTGIAARLLASEVQYSVGLDFSAPMLRVGQDMACFNDHTNLSFVQATAHALPLADNSFDLVLASFGLNATDPRQTFPELHRVLASGGRLCFQEWGGQHQFDKLIFDTLSEYAVDDDEAPDDLIALRDFFMEERPWYRDLQTEEDFLLDLADYGFVDVTAREYRPLTIELPFEVFLRYKLSWTGPRAELAAMEPVVRGDCMDRIRQYFTEYIDGAGNIHYDPLIIRVQAWKMGV
jgi:SAM-dependent methyltransferase